MGKQIGFYHFAQDSCGGTAKAEAEHFVNKIKPYVGKASLYLDWEATAFWNPSPHFSHARLFDHLVRGFDRWPGDTINERVEAYVLDLGFAPEDIAAFRDLMLEPAP